MLAQSAAAAVGIVAAAHAQSFAAPVPPSEAHAFKFSLNTATLRGQKLSLPEQVEIAAKAAAYHAIEPWLDEMHPLRYWRRQTGRPGKADRLTWAS